MTKAKAFTILSLLLIFSVFMTWSGLRDINNKTYPKSDGVHYTAMAYNLFHYKTVSLSRKDTQNPKPSNLRAPGYSFFLASVIAFSPTLASLSWEQLFEESNREKLKIFKHSQLALNILSYLASALLVFVVTESILTMGAFLILVAYCEPLAKLANSFYAENMICLAVPLAALTLTLAFKFERLRLFALAGFTLGALVLVRSPFLYSIAPILVLYFALGKWPDFKTYLLRMSIFSLFFVLVVGPWAARNYLHFSKMSITEGLNGRILAIRAFSFNTMTQEEWLASFVAWSHSKTIHSWAKDRIDEKHMERFSTSSPKGFRQGGRAIIEDIVPSDLRGAALSRTYKKMAMDEIRSKPFAHIATSVALMHRGIKVSGNYFYNLAIYASLLIIFCYSLISRSPTLLGLSILPAFSHGIFASFSHFNTRYSKPTHLLALACALVLVTIVVNRISTVFSTKGPVEKNS